MFGTILFRVTIPVTSPIPVFVALPPIVNTKVPVERPPLVAEGLANGKCKAPFTLKEVAATPPPVVEIVKF